MPVIAANRGEARRAWWCLSGGRHGAGATAARQALEKGMYSDLENAVDWRIPLESKGSQRVGQD